MDDVCGGDWWRDLSEDSGSAEEASQRIAKSNLAQLATASGTNGWVIDVRNAEHHKPKYSLVFLSRHRNGMISFGEAVSKSSEEWPQAVVEPGTLLDDPDTFRKAELELATQWVVQIKTNISDLLVREASVPIGAGYKSIMSGVLGQAREMHVRKAVKELYVSGVTTFNGVTPNGMKLWDQVITR